MVAAALAIRQRGHRIAFVGDPSLQRALAGVGVEVQVFPAELDLGPRFARTMREAMATAGGDMVAAGPLVERGQALWAEDVAKPVRAVISAQQPDAVVTSLFGVEVLLAHAALRALGDKPVRVLVTVGRITSRRRVAKCIQMRLSSKQFHIRLCSRG